MAEALMLAAIFTASYLGFALFALAQSRHVRRVLADDRAPVTGTALRRALGAALLASALCGAWLRDGASFGSLLWLLLLTVAATAVAFTLSWRPRWLRPLLRRRSRPIPPSTSQALTGETSLHPE